MYLNTYGIAIILALLSMSCADKAKQAESTTQMEMVMDIHDEVMPKMGTIGKLVGELKSRVDSTETGQVYEKAMNDLQDAHKAMMDWMQGFGSRFEPDEILDGKSLTKEKKIWLDEEEKKVRALREQINSSISRAEALLKK